MRKYVSDLIKQNIKNKKIPNKETLKAISEVEKGEDLIEIEDIEDFFERLDR